VGKENGRRCAGNSLSRREMLQTRAPELANEITRSTGATRAQARSRVTVPSTGWFISRDDGQVSPDFRQRKTGVTRTSTHHPEPTGVVVALAPDEPALLPLVS